MVTHHYRRRMKRLLRGHRKAYAAQEFNRAQAIWRAYNRLANGVRK